MITIVIFISRQILDFEAYRKFYSPTPSTTTKIIPLKLTTSYQYPSGIIVFIQNAENQPQYKNDLLWLKT
jgi:hypothetical protein